MTERRKMKKPENVWFLLGALAVLAMGIPYLILGKDAIFVYHDQLDGEVILICCRRDICGTAAVFCRNL